MELHELLKKSKSCKMSELAKVNYLKLPVKKIELEDYNSLVNWCKQQKKLTRGIKRTASGGISIYPVSPLNVWESSPRYSNNKNCLGAELVILIFDTDDMTYFGGRFQLGIFKGAEEHEHKVYGRQAYCKFKELLANKGIDIEKQFLESKEKGLEYKAKIEKPLIQLAIGAHANEIYEHCYHLDRNSSYGAGMYEFVPEWRELVQYLYDNRKFKKENKDILNMSLGFFQSKFIDYRLAHISEYTIRRNNEEVCNKAIELIRKGCKILLYNTDGFWFKKPEQMEIESSYKLGEFKLDHKDCTLRIKSEGVYEYIEDGKYYPVVRGTTKLDRELPREEWKWGDIYREGAKMLVFSYQEDGTIKEKTMDDAIMESYLER